MDDAGDNIPHQIDQIRNQAISEIERYMLAYAAAAYGALYATEADFRDDISGEANAIIGNAMKMAVRHLELVQQLRVEVEDEPEDGDLA